MTHRLQVELDENHDHKYSTGNCMRCGEKLFRPGQKSEVRHETDMEIEIVMKHEEVEKSETKDFLMWLDDKELITMVHDNLKDDGRANNIDFVIGDEWPDPFDDDHITSLRRSALSFMFASIEDYYHERFITEAVIHLPPAPDELEIEPELPDCFDIHFGTRALGGMSAPEGVLTPHVQSTRSVTFDEVKEATEEVLEVYRDVYDEGEKVIKEQP